jgi:hypothetical protein
MQYMLLIYGDESRLNQAPGTPISPNIQAYVDALRKAGVMVGGERLHPTRRSKRISRREGKIKVIDGPYADTREQLGGYFLLEVSNEQEAIAWAEKCPAIDYATVELRPIVEAAAA